MKKNKVVLKTEFSDLKLCRRGKVRDVYDLGDTLLIVSTDRISCFDVVLPTGIPGKGEILTALSCFWFEFIKDIIPTHFISADVDDFPEPVRKYREVLQCRSMLVEKAQPLPVECIVRGYLSGSGWKDYKAAQSICGIKLPAGLKESDKLPQVIFTPSTKADIGHDENVSQDYISDLIGKDVTDKLKNISICIYEKARDYAKQRGIIIADTKFEFGKHGGEVILIDEILTPDSSRFWPSEGYKPGKPQPSFDKQFVRDYLETLDWDKTSPGPRLPDEIVEKTKQKYQHALKILTAD
ncbi:MAG: phosphoribosylaminoimidazolesuccinocarboxamide synthase [Candidatus Omnitrophica bacterium]|nr:phosphoribosylaminoimidazolesuccinocarboxamide synthase [Candidatus Omnitrophota bacterium]